MSYQTDERLKSYLDTNQLHREQMCLAVLALDKRFSDVRPRHPRGGSDGGRDIEAMFRREHRAYGAVGFVNQAADTNEKKGDIRKKFADDLDAAVLALPRPAVFVFFTNVNLASSEKTKLTKTAKAAGFIECDIFDRERLRIALDSPDGLAARYQYLGIPLSDAEQASFFAKWGDDINSVISTGFQEVRRTLDHLLFLQESYDAVSDLRINLELDQKYPADDIGHFRVFCKLNLLEPKLNILQVLFGASDKAARFRTGEESRTPRAGIRHGIGGAQWIEHFRQERNEAERSENEARRNGYVQVGTWSSIGYDPVRQISISYSTDTFIRFDPVLSLRDFNGCIFLLILNRSLAERVSRIHVRSNGYKLMEVEKSDFHVDTSEFQPSVPTTFDAAELADAWVRIRPNGASVFRLSYSDRVPVRLYASRQASEDRPPRDRNS